MKKINFQDYPNTDSPVSSNNLNIMQSNIEEEFDKVEEEISEIDYIYEYSLNEIKTNKKWIDGRFFYNKVIPINSDDVLSYDPEIDNFDNLSITGWCYLNNGSYNSYNTINDGLVHACYKERTQTVEVYCADSTSSIEYGYLILEYLKTTDIISTENV